MKKTAGIRTQLVGGIAIITIAAIGLIGMFSIILIQHYALLGKIGEAEKIGRLVRTSLFNASGKLNEKEFKRHVRIVVRDAGIKAIEFKDTSGKVSYADGNMSQDETELLFFYDGIKVYRVGGGVFIAPESVLRVVVKEPPGVILSSPQATFTLSLRELAVFSATMRKLVIIYAIVDSILIVGVGIYFLSVSIIRPIRKLQGAATRIAGGDLGVRAEYGDRGYDEIASMAVAFNTMADRLAEEIKRLERLNTELVETQEELLKTSTLAAVGELAAGLAHEIGNPLGAVSGYMGLLQGELDDAERLDIVQRTEKEISRVNRIVREFLDLSRPSSRPPTKVDVNELLRETTAFISNQAELKGVRTEFKLKHDLPRVIIDEDKLRQVFMNIFLNAADSMGADGTVTITTDTCLQEQARGSGLMRKGDKGLGNGAAGRKRKQYVTISFSDTGCGISDEDKKKIFDPFFTMKEAGRGTGLGLFVSQAILKRYGGAIEVDSVLGRGSVFKVILERGSE